MNAMTARELRARVARKFGRNSTAVLTPEHIVLYEVPFMGRPRFGLEDAADMPVALRSRQRIDVVAVGIWGRTGGLIHGFEVKVARSDLLAELRDLTKSEGAVRAVDRWWLVLAAGIRREPDPIPETWGILEARGRGLTIIREPSEQPGECRALLAGLVMRAIVAPQHGRAQARNEGYIAGLRYAEAVTGRRFLR